jgi:hypothetical protein
MNTPSTIIDIAKLSQFLFSKEIQRRGLFGGGIDLDLPQKIYNIRKSVEWAYENGYMFYDENTLQKTANYLYAICTPMNISAAAIIDSSKAFIITEDGKYITTEDSQLLIIDSL